MHCRSKCLPFLTYGIFSIFSHFQPKRKGKEKENKKGGWGGGRVKKERKSMCSSPLS